MYLIFFRNWGKMLKSHLLYVTKDEKVLDNKAEKFRNILEISQKHTFYQPRKSKNRPIIRRDLSENRLWGEEVYYSSKS